MTNMYDPVNDVTYAVHAIPDRHIVVQEYAGERLRHVTWLDPAAAVELAGLLTAAAEELAERVGA